MKGDFSRLGPWPEEQTTGVWLQQGRPLLDADWNALQFTLRHMVAGAVDAMLGGPAASQADAGFEVSVRGSLPLNQDPQGARQAVYLMPSHSLPFRGRGAVDQASQDEDAGAEAAAPDADLVEGLSCEFHDHHDRPYVLELEFRAKRGAQGVVVERPGAVVVSLDAAGQLILGLETEDPVTASGGPVGIGRVRLALVHSGRHYRLFRDGVLAAEWRGQSHPQPLVHARALSLGGPPNAGDTGFLACNLDHLRVWTAWQGRDGHRHHRFHLACDLDFGAIHHGRIHDESGRGNDGRLASTGAMPEASVQVWLGAGRYFVDGARIANPRPTPLDDALPEDDQDRAHLVYLEVWERGVSALEQPDLREVALGGPDTVIQSRMAWRTRAVHGQNAEAALNAFRALEAQPRGRAGFLHAGAPLENALYRVEIQHPGWAYAWPPGPKARQAVAPARRADDGGLTLPAKGIAPVVGAPLLAFAETGDHWVVRIAAGSDANELKVTGGPPSWPVGAIGLLSLASFKWSPDNAAEAYDVEGIVEVTPEDGGQGKVGRVQLATPGFNGLDLQVGDWVELTSEADELVDQPGLLYAVAAFDKGLLQVDLAGWDSDDLAGQTRLTLRRWGRQVRNSPAPSGGYPPVATEDATTLDDHVRVSFDGEGFYAAGDWWTLALRQETDAPWAPDELSTTMAPGGGGFRRVPLAVIDRHRDGPRVSDLRRLFADLPTLSGGVTPPQPGPPDPPWPHPPGPRPHEPTSEEVAHWLRRHAPGVRLLSEGEPPPGFHDTGESLTVRCLEKARWEPVRTPQEAPRGAGQAVFVGGRVIFLEDGASGVWSWSSEGGWSALPPRPLARRGFAAVAAGSTVVVVGGAGGIEDALCEPVEILLPDGGWRRLEHTRVKAFQPAAAVIGSMLYVTGGRDRSGTVLRRCEAIDLNSGESFELPSMHHARAEHAMAAYDGSLWAFGGIDGNGNPSKTAEAHPLLTGRWRPIAEMALPARGLAAAAIDDGIVIAGGAGGGEGLHVETSLYRPARDSWSPLAPLPGPVRSIGLAADIDPDGESALYRVGGHGPNGAVGDFAALKIRRMLHLLASSEEH